MPTYEYRCENGHEFEAFQKMSDEPLTECPKCGAPAVRRISPGVGLLFKGSGFYITDYKKAGEKEKAEGSESAGKAKSEGGSSGAGGDGKGAAGSTTSSSGSGGSGGSSGDSGGGSVASD